MFNQAYTDGARLHTNSWGAAANFGAYEKMAATVDQVMFDKEDLLILFAAGNSGVDKNKDGRIDANSIGTPGTAKNALTVGASENLLSVGGIQKKIGELKPSPENWPSSPITDSRLSDDVNGIAMFSSRGPTADGRTKPDIVAPGTNILSVKSQQKGAEVLWGAYNNDYVYSGGTSMACPLTAASAAIARQFLIEKMAQVKPSAALVKAYLLHTATEMFPGQYGEVGANRGQEILTLRPNNDEGYGRVNVAEVVTLGTSGSLLIADSKGVATGETETAKFLVAKSGHLVVNIVWTDAPGSVNASKSLVNDLDLEVVLADGKVLSANDQINNHSFVQGTVGAGEVTIRVKGVNIPMGKSGKQPFALVASVK
jgi:subtilisin family serine protease